VPFARALKNQPCLIVSSTSRKRKVHYVDRFAQVDDAALRTICSSARPGDHIVVSEGPLRERFGDRESVSAGEVRAAAEQFVHFGSTFHSQCQSRLAILEEVWQDPQRRTGELALLDAIAAAERCEKLGFRAGVSLRTASAILVEGVACLNVDASRTRMMHEYDDDTILLVAGNAGSDDAGRVYGFDRQSADEVAAILTTALRAAELVVWSERGAPMSAGPERIAGAFPLPHLNYREAAELAALGVSIPAPRALATLRERGIPLQLRSLREGGATTTVSSDAAAGSGYVRAVVAVPDLALIMYEGPGMVGRPGFAGKAFEALAERRVSVNMVSLAAGEQNMCFVVRETDREEAVAALEDAFSDDRVYGDVSRISAIAGCAVIAAIGDRMRERPGLAGQMFSTLGRTGVNVLAIAEGAAETNISAVVRADELRHALKALHEAFALNRRRAHVFVLGVGVVGGMMLDMMRRQEDLLLNRMNLKLQLVGAANSRRLLWDVEGVSPDEARGRLEREGREADLDAVLSHLVSSRLDRLIVVDATASDVVARRYPELLERRIAVVTPNKRANTLDFPYYDRLRRASAENQVPYLYETTVGAGLPVISTLRDLVRSGDHVVRLEGVLSGTLSYVFNRLAEGIAFSTVVHAAREAGYTEPDPRDDLNGEDVARKLLILAREMGLEVEREDVIVESLVPENLNQVPLDEFLERISEMDETWGRRRDVALANGERPMYIGKIEGGRLEVAVRMVPERSPLFGLNGTDNMLVYTTERYFDNPLVIRGPGAGPAVTAAGILADVVRAAELVS
jgi:bifunctional aspartokinase / homoserine dehydrogenase 1